MILSTGNPPKEKQGGGGEEKKEAKLLAFLFFFISPLCYGDMWCVGGEREMGNEYVQCGGRCGGGGDALWVVKKVGARKKNDFFFRALIIFVQRHASRNMIMTVISQ